MNDLTDRAAIYAAMADEDAGEVPTVLQQIDIRDGFYSLERDGQRVELVTADFARSLQQTVNAQARVIQQMERQFARIASALRQHRQQNNRLGNALNDINRDLDNKIDRRD